MFHLDTTNRGHATDGRLTLQVGEQFYAMNLEMAHSMTLRHEADVPTVQWYMQDILSRLERRCLREVAVPWAPIFGQKLYWLG